MVKVEAAAVASVVKDVIVVVLVVVVLVAAAAAAAAAARRKLQAPPSNLDHVYAGPLLIPIDVSNRLDIDGSPRVGGAAALSHSSSSSLQFLFV